MSNMILFGGVAGGSTITAPIIGKDFTWTGEAGTYQVLQDDETNWRIKFLSSGTFTPKKAMNIDAFLVGGGGGYTKTVKSIILSANTSYPIVVGAGGAPSSNGGDSSCFGTTCSGGIGATSSVGGAGGSGGGGSGYTGQSAGGGNGGSDGSDGKKGGTGNGGKGQGTTTREFGESTGDLYSGGGGGGTQSGSAGAGGAGGGGTARPVSPAVENSGGGGYGSYSDNAAGSGGSGIVIIRNHRS